MKKILVLAVISLFLMIPPVSFAKIAISDSDLAAITGQISVSVDMSKLKPLKNISNLSIIWDDVDGFSGYTDPGYFGTTDFTVSGTTTKFGSGDNAFTTVDITFQNGLTVVKANTPEIIIGGTSGMNLSATFQLGANSKLVGAKTLGSLYIGGIIANIPPGEVTATLRSSSTGISGSGRFFAQ